MANFTFYAFGTRENIKKTKNIISQFYKHSVAIPPDKVHTIDGPSLFGREISNSAQASANELLAWLKNQKDEVNSVNLSGFSRGAIMCIRIANILKKTQTALERQGSSRTEEEERLLSRLQKIDLNLFLLDPVAGLTAKGHPDSRIIPDNVSNYIAILQKDERRRDFKPQDITRIIIANPNKTKVTMLPMYGTHSSSTKIKKFKNRILDSGAKIVWHSMYYFLTQHGSRFKDNQIPPLINYQEDTFEVQSINDPKELLKIFSQNHLQKDKYFKSGLTPTLVRGIPVPKTARTLNHHLSYYVKNSAFFVNQLERELFKISYPRTFNYLFENNTRDPRFPEDSHCSSEKVIEELNKIKIIDSALFNRLLERRTVISGTQGIVLGPPQGYNTLEPCATMQQIVPDLVPESVKAQTELMNRLAQLEMGVYRLTFQYEREKSEFNFARERSHSSHSKLIRKEINAIVNYYPLKEDGFECREEKYERVLDTLEYHYKKLILSNIDSDLTDALEKILADYGREYSIQASEFNQCLVEFVYGALTLVKMVVGFVGELGYIGGSILFALGTALENIGARANELIGEVGWNPLKALAIIVVRIIEVIGFAVKNSFGLKPLTHLLTSGIKEVRSWIVETINTTTIKRIDPLMANGLQDIYEEAIVPTLESECPKKSNVTLLL